MDILVSLLKVFLALFFSSCAFLCVFFSIKKFKENSEKPKNTSIFLMFFFAICYEILVIINVINNTIQYYGLVGILSIFQLIIYGRYRVKKN